MASGKPFWEVIASIMPIYKNLDWLRIIFDEAKPAQTWEIRLDAALDVQELFKSLESFKHLFLQRKVIFTYRPKGQGGSKKMSPEVRKGFWTKVPSWLGEMIDNQLMEVYVDLELDLLEYFQKESLSLPFSKEKILGSWHDFNGNPKIWRQHYERLIGTKVSFLKFVAMVNSQKDAEELRQILDLHVAKDPRPLSCLGMGKEGERSRTEWLGASAGSYGYLPGRASAAPGQLSILEILAHPHVREVLHPK
jgi:3-dehydroquinate dehydratase type I